MPVFRFPSFPLWLLQYRFGADPVAALLDPLEKELLKTTHTNCGKSHTLFTASLLPGLAHVRAEA